MKRVLISFLVLLFLNSSYVLAEGSLEDFSNIDRAWDGQDAITNEQFEEAIDTLEANKKKKEAKQRKKLIKRVGGGGTSLHPGLDPSGEIKPMSEIGKEDALILNVPVHLIVGGVKLDKGFYRILAERKEGKVYLLFYQSQFFKGKVEAYETDDDFGEETLDFVNIAPYNQRYMRLVYGSLELNAYAYIQYEQ